MNALTIMISYLTGRSVSTSYNDRERAEWPPHPARVYSALVATWAESEDSSETERAALEWLATLDAPSVYASDASHRDTVPHFVPVNDPAVLDAFDRPRNRIAELERVVAVAREQNATPGDKAGAEKARKSLEKEEKKLETERAKLEKLLADDQGATASGKYSTAGVANARSLLPDHRAKQPRSFPSVSPDDPRVFLRWNAPASDLELHAPAIDAVAGRVVRLGHSSSLVSCSVVDESPTPNWEPCEGGRAVLRVPGPGQFARLEEAFARHREIEPRVLPCRFQGYERVGTNAEASVTQSCFGDDWIVFRQIAGRRLPQTSGVELARALRGALLKSADGEAPELMTGHATNGEPSERPHLAIVPLPFVGHTYATGEILGLAVVFPRNAADGDRRAVFRAIGRWEQESRVMEEDELVDTPPLRLTLGRAGVIEVERVEWGLAPLKTLRPTSWCAPSRSWVTATPIALDRNPGDLFSRDDAKASAAYAAAEQSVVTACERVGLPAPSRVDIHPSVPLMGAAKARAYPAFPVDPRKNQRVKVHARIEFPIPVSGPVLLGAGRYYGLGLCFPLPNDKGIAQ